jgi:hypothetical protein
VDQPHACERPLTVQEREQHPQTGGDPLTPTELVETERLDLAIERVGGVLEHAGQTVLSVGEALVEGAA